MPLYSATFIGCKSGAIGICYPIDTMVRGTNEKDAELNLYKEYDHIQRLKLVAIVTDAGEAC